MAKYLNERQIGFDTQLIGFPNLGDCLGAVLQNDGGLFGFHIYGLGGLMDAEFARYIQASVGFHGNSSHLYGSCYWPRRYGGGNGLAQWTAEMGALAQAIGYHGPVSGIDTSSGTKIKSTETTYLEYRLGGHGHCDIYYKRMSKMDTADTQGTVPDPDIKLIRKDMAAMKLAGRTHDDAPIYGHYDLPGHRATTSASVVATRSNKGEMHRVKPGSLVTFNHP